MDLNRSTGVFFISLLVVGIIGFSGCQYISGPSEPTISEHPSWMTGGYGEAPGQFYELSATAIDHQGRIVVADNRLRRLTWFVPTSESPIQAEQVRYYSTDYGSPALNGLEIGTINAMTFHDQGLLISESRGGIWLLKDETARRLPFPDIEGRIRAMAANGGRVFILVDDQVMVFSPGGEELKTIQFTGAEDPSIRSMYLSRDEKLYLAAEDWSQVLVYSTDGKELNRFGEKGDDLGQFSGDPRGLGVDPDGNIYVCDRGTRSLDVFNSEGIGVMQVGGGGAAPGQFNSCGEILIDENNELLIAMDSTNFRLQAFDLTGETTETGDHVVHTSDFLPTKLPDHIVMTLRQRAETERNITWRTNNEVDEGLVQLADVGSSTEVSSFDWSNSQSRKIRAESVEVYGNLGPYSIHEASISGLVPGSRYAYRVGDGSLWSGTKDFFLPEGTDKSLKAVVLGDSRNRMNIWEQIINASAEERPAFIINTGDLVANGEDMNDWGAWFAKAENVFSRFPLMPCLGNHERQSPNYFHAFALPKNAGPGLEEQSYSFDYGPAHWVVLNTEIDLDQQAEWLEADLAATSKPWIFAFYHRPAYAGHPTRGDGNDDIRASWVGLFERFGVDIAWQGHDHYYFRTKPVLGNKVVASGEGPIYVTTGGSGAPLYKTEPNQYMEIAESVDHYCLISLTPERCEVTVYRRDGSLLDRFSLSPRTRK